MADRLTPISLFYNFKKSVPVKVASIDSIALIVKARSATDAALKESA